MPCRLAATRTLLCRSTFTVVAIFGVFSLVGCSRAATERFNESTAPLLVPTDPDFTEHFGFMVESSPNNYEIFSNVDSEYNSSIDKSKAVVGYQIGDLESWLASPPAAEVRQETYRSLIEDSAEPLGGTCEALDGLELQVYCPSDELYGVLIRRFSDGPNAPILLLDTVDVNAASRRYLSQEFETVPIAESSGWFHKRAP